MKQVYKDLIIKYNQNRKKEFDKTNFIFFYITRPISLLMTVPFIYLRITANQATFISFLFAIVASILFLYGEYSLAILGSILFLFYYLLDFVDGNLARYHQKTNFFGKFIDGFVGEISYLILFISITVFFYKNSDITCSILSFLIGISFTVHSSYFNRKNKLIMEMNVENDSINLDKDKKTHNTISGKNILKRFAVNIKEILTGVFPYIFVLSLIFDFFPILIYIMSIVLVINLFHIVYDLKLSYSKLNKFRNF